MSSTSSPGTPYALAALKTKGIEKSVWEEFMQLALEVKPLNLGLGFPDFAAPYTLRKALSEVCMDNENVLYNQYTRGFGHPRLVNALSKLYSKVFGKSIDPINEVLVTGGAFEALFVTINGLVNPGDEVIIIEPFFDCYEPQVKLAGGTPIFVPLRPTKTEGRVTSADWKLDPSELANAFSSRTKAIIVNTPNNPLGKVFSVEELTMIADLCKKHNSFAIMDEVYEWMTYDGVKHIRMANLPEMWERCITIGSAGKTFSVTGWKTGWAIGPKEILAGPKVVHQHSVYICTTPIQEAVARGFEIEIDRMGTPECYFNSLPAELIEKRNLMSKILSDAGFNPIIPEGGYFILADARELKETYSFLWNPNHDIDSNLHTLALDLQSIGALTHSANVEIFKQKNCHFILVKKIDIGGDMSEPRDYRFVKWLSRNRKLQGIPPSAFFSVPNKSIGEDYIRLCFIKEDANLQKAGEILGQLKKDLDSGAAK